MLSRVARGVGKAYFVARGVGSFVKAKAVTVRDALGLESTVGAMGMIGDEAEESDGEGE